MESMARRFAHRRGSNDGGTPDEEHGEERERHPGDGEVRGPSQSQFMLDSLAAGRPDGEVPWGGQGVDYDDEYDVDDEGPTSPQEAQAFSWGPVPAFNSADGGEGGGDGTWGYEGNVDAAANLDDWVIGAEERSPARGARPRASSTSRVAALDGKKMKESAARYRRLRDDTEARRQGEAGTNGNWNRRHSGASSGYGRPGSPGANDAGVGTDWDMRDSTGNDVDFDRLAAERAAAAEALGSAPQRALEEARAILEGGHSSDEDLLRPEGEREWVDETEGMRRTFAGGDRDDGMNGHSAWGVPPLQPTDEDLRKQRLYERLHRMTFQRRNAANDFGDPDEIEDLMLDVDKKALPPAAVTDRGAGESPGEVDAVPGAAAGAGVGVGVAAGFVEGSASAATANDDEDKKKHEGNDQPGADGWDRGAERASKGAGSPPPMQELGYLTPFTGNYLNLVLGEDRTAAAATAAAGANNAKAASARATRDAAPAHLRRFMRPQELELPAGAQVVKISGGKEHALVLLRTSDDLKRILPQHQENEGRVLVMGAGDHGQLGLGDDRLQTVPVVLSTLGDHNGGGGGGGRVRVGGERMGGHGSGIRRVIDVAAGAKHSVVVSGEHEVAAFGTDHRGCTGQGETGEGRKHRLPRWMYWITTDTTRMVACAAGEGHTVLLSASWHVFTVGDGARGKLGHGNERSQLTPRRVAALMGLKIASVAAGHNHTLLITDTGLLYGCGANSRGQLGTGDRVDQLSPVRLRHMDFVGGVAVVDDEPERRTMELQERILGPLPGSRGQFLTAAEEDRPFAQPTEQQLAAAVKAREEVLGIRQQPSDDELRLKMGLPELRKRGSKVVQVCGGRAHTVILTDVGRVYVCGQSNRGQLGQNDKKSSSTVTAVSTMVNLSCVQIAAGDEHTVMLTTLGHVYVCGNNATGQLGDGTLEDSLVPKCLQPIIKREDLLTRSEYQLKELQDHPMFGLLVEQVFASGSSTFAVVTGGERVFVCGSGAYGFPYDRNPTGFADMLRLKLNDREQKKTLVMASTVRMLRPDEQGFQDLVRQMVLYSLYNEKVLAHIMKATLDEVMRRPGFVVLHASLLQRCMHLCLDCTAFAFRRIILLAIEDMGVKLLQAQDEVLHRRLLQRMGWARYQQQQREAGGAGGGRQMTYFGMITDKESYNDFKRFREDCKSLQRFVREMFEVRGILLEDDIRDLAAGLPGSQHSIGITDSERAKNKLTFFRSLARWKSPGERAAEEATRAAGLGAAPGGRRASGSSHLTGVAAGGGNTGANRSTVVRQQGLMPDQPLPVRAAEEAAWECSDATGWEAYRLPGEVKPKEGSGWGVYMDRRRREAKLRSPVVVPGEAIDAAEAAAAEEGLDQTELERLTRRREEERRKRVGMNGKRIVESTLAPSFHRDNTVATAVRTELETNMARRMALKLGRHPLSGGSVPFSSEGAMTAGDNTHIGTEDLATRRMKMKQKLTSMAAAGESVREIEEYQYNAETDPSFGYCTQEEVDGAPPEVQAERAILAFKFARKKPA